MSAWSPAPDEPSRPVDEPSASPAPLEGGAVLVVRGHPVAFDGARKLRLRGGSLKTGPRRKNSDASPPAGGALPAHPSHPSGTSSTPLQAFHSDPLAANLSAGQLDSIRHYRVRAVTHLRHYAPAKVDTVDYLLSKHRDSLEAMMAHLVEQYGPEVERGESPFLPRFQRFYQQYDLPSERLADQLEDYAGKEEELIAQLVEQHGAEPRDPEEQAPGTEDPAVRERVERFYRKWNPGKLPIVDELMSRVRCAQDVEDLMEKLVGTYGPEPGEGEAIPERERSKSLRPAAGGGGGGGMAPAAVAAVHHLSARTRASLPAPHTISVMPTRPSDVRQRLLRFYTHCNPDNIERVDKVLVNYRGMEEELFKRLVSKYGPEPSEESEMSVDDAARGDYTAVLDSSSPKTLQRLNSISSSPGRKSPATPPRPKKVFMRVTDDLAKLKALTEANPKMQDAEFEKWAGRTGTFVKESKPDNAVALAFAGGGGAWVPKEAVAIVSSLDCPQQAISSRQSSAANPPLSPEQPGGSLANSSFGGVLFAQSDCASSPSPSFGSPSAQLDAKHVSEDGHDSEDEEDEEEDEDATEETPTEAQGEGKRKGDEAPVEFPEELIVNSKGYASECSGTYLKVAGDEANGYPVWERQRADDTDLEAWLFSTPTGEWKVTDERADFESGDGYFNTDTHEGVPPHKVRPWLGEDDAPDPNISVVTKNEQEGDRVVGGHLVLGRVAAELTEAQILYASLQRRKKFKVKKEVPAASKCAACKKFEAVCSQCYTNHRKVQKQRREYLRDQYPSMDLRRQVGVFFSAVAAGEDEDVKVMLEQGADVNWMAFFKKKANEMNSLPEGGCHISPLHVACAYHRPEVAMTLISSGARYRRDPNAMIPLDYITDDNCAHDVMMYLDELNTEYATAVHVQEAWDIYNDEEFEEARDAFFELLMQYPDRDTCHLGLIYSHLGLGDIEACLEASRNSLKAPDVQWIECPKVAVQRAMERAIEIHHERAHAEETDGCIKRCGCVVYPPGWTVPLRALRRASFPIIREMFSWLPATSAWNTWLALWRSPLLRKAVEMHIITNSRAYKEDTVRIITSVPAWVASFREAVVDHCFDAWDRRERREGDLAHVQVETIECESIPAFPYFMLKVSVISRYHVQSNFSKMKGWWNGGRKAGGPREAMRSGSPSNGMLQGESFLLKLEDSEEEFGLNIVTNDNHVHNRKVRVRGIEFGSPACRGGVLPGYLLRLHDIDVHDGADLEKAVDAVRDAKLTEIPITIAVDVCEGSWVEAVGLTKSVELNGVRGCVEKINIKSNQGGGAVQVKFSEHGSVWMRPSNLFFITSEGSTDGDAASIGTSMVSSRLQSPSEQHSTTRSGSHSAMNDSCYSKDSNGGYPNPVPLKRSRNEGYERFKREKLKLSIKRDTLIFNTHLVVAPNVHPGTLYQSTWPTWRLELQDTKVFRPGGQ